MTAALSWKPALPVPDLRGRRVTARCHCGAVELRLDLPHGLDRLRRCDCSFCRRRGAVVASVKLAGLDVIRGDTLKLYTFGTHTAQHHFCGTCGIYTHHRRRSDPTEYGVNVACIEGVNPSELGEIPWEDGVNHPSDR
ncbi:GFA family protein [Oceanomicrobium pacificus]|uniref:GFA family protein n=1 Tax=Oceanomicrobium pacificus TaxID=2692916 RepID=A0A6B0TW25_9RHOB|nr:GFA family protein [Oceanomicrobium pacificus]MXU66879.1 GFA family protein [Oceanomicrobium pacificus]